jgi:hypothetical protein
MASIGNNDKDIYKFALIRLDGAEEAKKAFRDSIGDSGDDEDNGDNSPDKAEAIEVLTKIIGGKIGELAKDNPSSALVLMAASAFMRTISLPYASSELTGLSSSLDSLNNDVRALEKYLVVRDDDMPDMTEELALTKKLRDAIKGMLDASGAIKEYIEGIKNKT